MANQFSITRKILDESFHCLIEPSLDMPRQDVFSWRIVRIKTGAFLPRGCFGAGCCLVLEGDKAAKDDTFLPSGPQHDHDVSSMPMVLEHELDRHHISKILNPRRHWQFSCQFM